MRLKTTAVLAAALMLSAITAWAETGEVRVAKQYGLGYLQLIMMEDQQLIEKHAKAAGLGEVKVTWATFRSSDVMNDALISGSIDFVCLGIPGIATIWAKTRGNIDVRAAAGLNALPLFLNVRGAHIKSLADFSDRDRIALPAVKVSMQAILLQMAAAKTFGDGEHARLDRLTVSMAHPDGLAAFLSGKSEITAHFTSAPFQYRELKQPGVRRLLTSTEVLGGKVSFNVVAATDRFRSANPKTYGAFLAALEDATRQINADKRAAAETYLRVTKDRAPIEEILEMMNDPEIEFTTRPLNLSPMVDFMHKTGQIRAKPASWRDLTFPNLHQHTGS